MTVLPKGLWQKVSADFVGPFPNKDMAKVFWDQYARYPVVEFVVIPEFTCVFHTYEIPEEVKSDNSTTRSKRVKCV